MLRICLALICIFGSLIVTPIVSAAHADEPPNWTNLTPYRNSLSGHYGYFDGNGIEVIGATFESAEPFSDGLARVIIDNKIGYIDAAGRIAVTPQFENAEPFHEGLALAWRHEKNDAFSLGRYGYIDRSGAFIINPQFDFGDTVFQEDSRFFSEGLARFARKDRWGFIDRAGHIAISPIYDSATAFSGGVSVVSLASKKNSTVRYVIIDRTGHEIPTAHVDSLSEFFEGVASFIVHTKDGDRYGYLAPDGKISVAASLLYGADFHEGLAVASPTRLYEYGYIGHDGTLTIPARYKEAHDFADGRARVKSIENGLYGYIDHSGQTVIQEKYMNASDFQGGLALVLLSARSMSLFGDGPKDRCSRPEMGGSCTKIWAFIKPDGSTAYAWSETEVARPTACFPHCFGDSFMYANPPLLSVTFNSTPKGAQVFAIPFALYDFDKSIANSTTGLKAFTINNGKTDVSTTLFSQKYHIIFQLNDKRSEIDIDLFRDGPHIFAADIP